MKHNLRILLIMLLIIRHGTFVVTHNTLLVKLMILQLLVTNPNSKQYDKTEFRIAAFAWCVQDARSRKPSVRPGLEVMDAHRAQNM